MAATSTSLSRALIDGLAAGQDVIAATALAASARLGLSPGRALDLLASGSAGGAAMRRLARGGAGDGTAPLAAIGELVRTRAADAAVFAALRDAGLPDLPDTSGADAPPDPSRGTPPADVSLGLVGTGAMGGALAEALVRNGAKLAVWDVDPVRARALAGAHALAGLDELVRTCEVVLTCLPTSAEVAGVAETLCAAAPGPRTLVDLTTGDPRVTRQLGVELREQGHAMVDAALSGGLPGVRAGSIAVFTGGHPGDVGEAATLLRFTAPDRIRYAGGLGAGQTLKLLNNYVAGVGRVLLAEALALALGAGFDGERFLAACDDSPAQSHHTSVTFRPLVRDPAAEQGFSLRLMRKDMRLAGSVAAEVGCELPGLDEALAAYDAAARTVGEDADVNAVTHEIAARAGVRLAPKTRGAA
jgi:3-hydroxyisobutyrate dehydrogenase